VSVFLADEQSVDVDAGPLRDLAESVLTAEGFPPATEVAVVLVDVEQMTAYHRRFLDRDGPTDVLSLPIEDLRPGVVPARRPGDPPLNLGDVFICPEIVRDRAQAGGVRFEHDMALMVVHGLLHLLGYDHADDGDAELMESRERMLLGSGWEPAR
jgi:probable rRNA maturation factor